MNKESNWNECTQTGAARTVTVDQAKIKSLINTALGRIRFLDENEVKETNANYIFEGYYSSLLELLHALLLKNGYKVLNHICIGYYIRDFLSKQDLFRQFDDCRFKRNTLIYYGRKMDFIIAKEAIIKCQTLIKNIQELP
tara:strand:+ start:148 stop:567 length:420 start_codon:yes stop_codon:yes gene_type:complete